MQQEKLTDSLITEIRRRWGRKGVIESTANKMTGNLRVLNINIAHPTPRTWQEQKFYIK